MDFKVCRTFTSKCICPHVVLLDIQQSMRTVTDTYDIESIFFFRRFIGTLNCDITKPCLYDMFRARNSFKIIVA